MSAEFQKLQPADLQVVNVFMPYLPQNKRAFLPLALSLWQKGAMEGQRKIEGGESIPFIATWRISGLPSDIINCRLQFDGNADLSYEVMLRTSELVEHLSDVIQNYKQTKVADFPQTFYRKLLGLEE
jgi:hypothetical protein